MIERDQLPEDAADWTSIVVELPRLRQNKAESCLLAEGDIFEYVQTESADLEGADRSRFRFLRTARVKGRRFWLWEYRESDGTIDYVCVQADARGNTMLGLNESNGLSPEQFLLAIYFGEVYWS